MFIFLQSLWLLIAAVFFVTDPEMSNRLLSVDFEVFGRVQGVFFRKYTQQEAIKLGLAGWCMNTEKGTVQGRLEGALENIQQMKGWLQNTGSPQSRIDKAVFTNEKEIKNSELSKFEIHRGQLVKAMA